MCHHLSVVAVELASTFGPAMCPAIIAASVADPRRGLRLQAAAAGAVSPTLRAHEPNSRPVFGIGYANSP
jgi:hypothetical protein